MQQIHLAIEAVAGQPREEYEVRKIETQLRHGLDLQKRSGVLLMQL